MVQGRQQRDSPKEDVRKFSVSSVRGQPDLAVHILIAKSRPCRSAKLDKWLVVAGWEFIMAQ